MSDGANASSRVDCLRRANACASAAIGADVRVDDIDVALGDGFDWAFADASAASDAIVCNYMCHSFCFLVN